MMLAPAGAMSAAKDAVTSLWPAWIARPGIRRCAPLNVVCAATPLTRTSASRGPRKSTITSLARLAVNAIAIDPRAVSRERSESSM